MDVNIEPGEVEAIDGLLEFEEGPTNKGGIARFHEGYRYVKNRKNYFKCSTVHCPATAIIKSKENGWRGIKKNEHNHPAAPEQQVAEQFKKQGVDAANTQIFPTKRRQKDVDREERVRQILGEILEDRVRLILGDADFNQEDDGDLLKMVTLLGIIMRNYANGLRDPSRSTMLRQIEHWKRQIEHWKMKKKGWTRFSMKKIKANISIVII